MSLTTNETNMVYRAVLRRDATRDELAQGASATNARALAETLFSDNEHQNTHSEISTIVLPMIRMYQAAYGRIPDNNGLDFWVDQIRAGTHTIYSIATIFIGTPEAVARSIDESVFNSDYVGALYTNVLGRAPDTGGMNFWLGEINSGARSRAQILGDFVLAPEFAADTTPRSKPCYWQSQAKPSIKTGSPMNTSRCAIFPYLSLQRQACVRIPMARAQNSSRPLRLRILSLRVLSLRILSMNPLQAMRTRIPPLMARVRNPPWLLSLRILSMHPLQAMRTRIPPLIARVRNPPWLLSLRILSMHPLHPLYPLHPLQAMRSMIVTMTPARAKMVTTPSMASMAMTPSMASMAMTPSMAVQAMTLARARMAMTPSTAVQAMTLARARMAMTPARARMAMTPARARMAMTPARARMAMTPSMAVPAMTPARAKMVTTPARAKMAMTPAKAGVAMTPAKAGVAMTPAKAGWR